MLKLSKIWSLASALWLWLVYFFLYFPLFLVIIHSFNSSRLSGSWTGFTLKWYELLLANASFQEAALNSIILALSSATGATLVGLLAAFCLSKPFVGRKVLHASIYILTVSPDIVMGISLLIFFICLGLPLGFMSLLLSHITLSLPFVCLTILARLRSLDQNLWEAARDLGATEWQAFRLIILPLILPAVLAGWLLAFTLSLDDVLISFFVSGPSYEVLPLKIYSMVRLGIKPDINALSAIIFGATIVLVVLSFILFKTKEPKGS